MENLSETQELKCLNCGQLIVQKGNFCPHCSQRIRGSKISVTQLLLDFLEGLFNLDSRFFHTVFKIWIPGFLPIAYIKGKRKSYLNPVRLFIFSMILFFAAMTLLVKFSKIDQVQQAGLEKLARAELVEKFDSLNQAYEIHVQNDSVTIDSFKTQLFDGAKPVSEDTVSFTDDLSILGVNLKGQKVLRRDLYRMSVDEILERYEITGFKERLIYGQMVKVYKDPKDMTRFAFGNLIWVVILTIVLTAFVMKLLYIRRNFYYVEHFIFLLNFHSVSFLLLALLMLLEILGAANFVLTIAGPLIFIYLSLYFIIAIKRYYKQHILKTLIKVLLTIISYFIFTGFLCFVVFLVSLLMF